MAEKRIKIQLTLPKDIVEKVEKETSDNFMSMSLWFEKITRQYFEEKTKASQIMKKKVIELDI
jgi:metal-responsive CopG/Arc/MetJ family transcriptional regulator